MKLTNNLFVFLLLFFFILAPRLDLKIVIHTGFFSVAFLSILAGIRQRNTFLLSKQLLGVTTFFSVLAVYHLIVSYIHDGNGIYFISICISVIVSVIFGWILAFYMTKHGNTSTSDLLDHLLMMCVIIAVLNSSIILVEYIFPNVKSAIESILLQVQEANINYAEHPFRLRGVASAGGAGLSVFNAMIVFIVIFLVLNRKITAGFALCAALILTCSNIFTGRTGLIISLLLTVVLFIIVLVRNLRSGFHGILRAFGMAAFFVLLLGFLANIGLDPEAAGWAFEWVDNIGSAKFESSSSDDLKSMLYIPNSITHLLFGIGFFEGVNKSYPRTDSGYLKSILSIGVPLSVLLYAYIIFMFSRVIKISPKYYWLVVSILCFMLIIEIKEPFLYQNYAARVIFLLSGASMFILARRNTIANGTNVNAS